MARRPVRATDRFQGEMKLRCLPFRRTTPLSAKRGAKPSFSAGLESVRLQGARQWDRTAPRRLA